MPLFAVFLLHRRNLIDMGEIHIGHDVRYEPGDRHWPGLIDEVAIYNRALSAADIQAIFNAGSAGKCKEVGLCTLTLTLSLTEGTLTLDVQLGSQTPATWNVWLIAQAEVTPLVSATLPVIAPPASVELDVPFFPALGTVGSRAASLVAQGKIQARPRGGNYPRSKAQGRAPSPRPVQSSAVQDSAGQPPTALVPSPTVASAAIIDLLHQTLVRLDTVEQDLKAIREDRHPSSAGQSSAEQRGAVQCSADLPPLSPEEARAERWNLWLPHELRQRIEAVAKARGVAPSRVVQEILWQAPHGRHASLKTGAR